LTEDKLILAQMVKKQKVVVKITKGLDIKRIKNINYLLRRLPNFPKVYCVFECVEDESNYLDVHGFCYKNDSDPSSNINIILEIMKFYKHKLVEYKNTLNLDEIKTILKQLIFGLMYAFESKGFIHDYIKKYKQSLYFLI
jgi:serine/threonine protein kinase